MTRLRKGRANTARGAANFLSETVSRVRYAGGRGVSRCPLPRHENRLRRPLGYGGRPRHSTAGTGEPDRAAPPVPRR